MQNPTNNPHHPVMRQFPWLMGTLAVVVLIPLGMWIEHTWGASIRQTLGLGGDPEQDQQSAHGHAHADDIELSPQALRNLGLIGDMVKPVGLTTFTRTTDIPARVVGRPGRTQIHVPAPMTCVVESIHVLQGESVKPGDKLFTIRLTHEELINAQTTYLKTLGELDVELREIARIQQLKKKGVIAGKTLFQHEYSRDKLKAALKAQREALLLHGLPEDKVNEIPDKRKAIAQAGGGPADNVDEILIHTLDIEVPKLHEPESESGKKGFGVRTLLTSTTGGKSTPEPKPEPARFVVQRISVQPGAFVNVGDSLSVLADLKELYIEGRAFEQDAKELVDAKKKKWKVQAVIESGSRREIIPDLDIVFIENEVEAESRALHFYVALPNEVLHPSTTPGKHQFIAWKFKPGQRVQLRVLVEEWEKILKLPVDAVARSGAENYVFQQNGNLFRRRPVHVLYRDQQWVVVKRDGSIFPTDVVALTGAHQMLMALKNKDGGGGGGHGGHGHSHGHGHAHPHPH